MNVRIQGSVALDAYFQFAAELSSAEPLAVHAYLEQIYAQLPFPDPIARGGQAPSGVPLRNTEFALQAAMDPRALATLSAMARMPTDQFLSPAELDQNLAATFGAHAPIINQSLEKTYAVGLIALFAALQGGSMEDLLRILGNNNPASVPFAKAIMQLAQAMQTGDPNAIFSALQGAEQGALPYAAGEAAIDMALAQDFLRRQFGIGPGAPYYGQGGLSSHVDRMCSCGSPEVPSGSFNGPASQAGLNALRAAQSQVGVREASGSNDGLPAQRYCGGRNEAWCGNFVSWAFRQAGHPLPGNQRSLASVAHMQNVMQREGRFHTGTPQPGDIVFFKDASGHACHVGIVESVSNGRVQTIEGNSGNQVARRSYPLGSSQISGYARVGDASAGDVRAPVSGGRTGGGADRLFSAITGQESGGNHRAVNQHSGALGIGQVMPANVRAWSKEALGYEISPETFAARPDLQNQIVRFKLDQYYREGMRVCGGDEREAVRYAAAKWYSGDGNKRNNTRAQTYGSGSYPSIAHYSDQVLRRYLA